MQGAEQDVGSGQVGMQDRLGCRMWGSGWDAGQDVAFRALCCCTGQSRAAPVPAPSGFTVTSSASGSHCQESFQAALDVSKGSILTED